MRSIWMAMKIFVQNIISNWIILSCSWSSSAKWTTTFRALFDIHSTTKHLIRFNIQPDYHQLLQPHSTLCVDQLIFYGNQYVHYKHKQVYRGTAHICLNCILNAKQIGLLDLTTKFFEIHWNGIRDSINV